MCRALYRRRGRKAGQICVRVGLLEGPAGVIETRRHSRGANAAMSMFVARPAPAFHAAPRGIPMAHACMFPHMPCT